VQICLKSIYSGCVLVWMKCQPKRLRSPYCWVKSGRSWINFASIEGILLSDLCKRLMIIWWNFFWKIEWRVKQSCKCALNQRTYFWGLDGGDLRLLRSSKETKLMTTDKWRIVVIWSSLENTVSCRHRLTLTSVNEIYK
jgi:hypothetical protein